MFSGYKLNNSYIFEELIGSGGMGEVWRAKRINLGDKVAIKVLKLSTFKDKDTIRDRLKKEAMVTSILNHPNICKIHDLVDQDNTSFLIMELLEGMDLHKLLVRKISLETEKRVAFSLYVVNQVLKALDSAHNINHPSISKILHRDIKPANIFLTKFGEVKLLDLGVAKVETDFDSTKTNNSFYSLHYTSPDLWENGKYNLNKYTEKNDIYSLGLVFYEILTGEKAFVGEGRILYEKIERGNISSIEQHKLPVDIVAVLKKWTNINPNERFNNVKELRQEIENLILRYRITDSILENLFLNLNRYTEDTVSSAQSLQSKKNKKISNKYLTISVMFLTLIIGGYIYWSSQRKFIAPNNNYVKEKIITKKDITRKEVYILNGLVLENKGLKLSFSNNMQFYLGMLNKEVEQIEDMKCGKEENQSQVCILSSKTQYGEDNSYFLQLNLKNGKVIQVYLGVYGKSFIEKLAEIKMFTNYKILEGTSLLSNGFELVSFNSPVANFAQITIMENLYKNFEKSIEQNQNNKVNSQEKVNKSRKKENTNFHFKVGYPQISDVIFKLGKDSVAQIKQTLQCEKDETSEKVKCFNMSSAELKNNNDYMIIATILKDEIVEIQFLFKDINLCKSFINTIEKSNKFIQELNYSYNKSWRSLNEFIYLSWLPEEIEGMAPIYNLKLMKI